MPSASEYNGMVRAVVKGGERVRADVRRIDKQTEIATLAALKAVQRAGKRNVRSRLRGAPRYDRRGASVRTGAAVHVDTAARPGRSGGPGRFTGSLYRAVGAVKKPKPIPGGGWRGGVGVGGIRVTNLYRRKNETKFPFFEPGIKKTEREARAIYAAHWRRAISK